MLGVAGAAGAEIITGVNWVEAPVQSQQTYLGNDIPFPLPAIAAIEVFVMAYVESQRGSETDRTKRMYPGGAFDPAGFSKGADFEKLKKEAMLFRSARYTVGAVLELKTRRGRAHRAA